MHLPPTRPPALAPPRPQPERGRRIHLTSSPSRATQVTKLPTLEPRPPATASPSFWGSEKPRALTGTPLAAWFSYDSTHDTERRLLPDFFEGEASAASGSRGPDAYKYYRNTLVRRFRSRPGRRLTLTEARRGLVGDVGSIRRVFDFLEEWGLINYGALLPGSKQAKEKREEAAPQTGFPAWATAPKKLCTRCRTVCGLAYFICEKVICFALGFDLKP
jgi:SWI/SNF related-matrix-associated actin-dependent regulator of chromatin subfamily C